MRIPNWVTGILVSAAFIAGYWLAAQDILRELEELELEISATAEAVGKEAGEELAAEIDQAFEHARIQFENRINMDAAFLRGYRCLAESALDLERYNEFVDAINRGIQHLRNVETGDTSGFASVASALNSELDALNCRRFDTEDGGEMPSPSRLITEETGD